MNNRLGVYYAFLTDSDTVDWRDFMRRASVAGCETAELSALKLAGESRAERDSIAALAGGLGLRLDLATALSPEFDVSSADESTRRRGIDFLKRNVELASRMGAAKLCGMLYGVHKCFPAGAARLRETLLENSAASLREVALSAHAHGVRLCIEAVNRFESPMINTAEEAVQFVRRIDSPAVGVHLDTFHMNIEEDDLAEAIQLAGPYLAHVHVCENNRKLPGRGHLHWGDILKALRKADYRDDIVIEALPFPYGSVSDRLNIWRRLIDEDADRELLTAVEYLRGILREQDAGGTPAAAKKKKKGDASE